MLLHPLLYDSDGIAQAVGNSYYQVARFMWPTWGPPRSCRPQMGPCWPHEPCYEGCLAGFRDGGEGGWGCHLVWVYMPNDLVRWHSGVFVVYTLTCWCDIICNGYIYSMLLHPLLYDSDGIAQAVANSYYQVARFMGPTWGQHGSCLPQMGPCWPHEPCYEGCLAEFRDATCNCDLTQFEGHHVMPN